MTKSAHRKGNASAADAAELAEIDRKIVEIDLAKANLVDDRRALSNKRRRVTDRIRKRATAR